MTNLTYSGESNYKSEENIKNNLLKIFLLYSLLSLLYFTLLNISGIRLFNSLNLTMSLVSSGGFLPSDSLKEIINTNFQKIVLIFTCVEYYFPYKCKVGNAHPTNTILDFRF